MNFSRQELYWGKKNQEKISKTHVTIMGVGALGSISTELLCRAGIGKLTIIDRDMIEESNLHRQVLYEEGDIGKWKAEVAKEKLGRINPECRVTCHVDDLNHENINKLVQSKLLLDCTDNLYTRRLINDYCRKNKIAWVYSGCIRDYGNVMAVFPAGPCFSCVFGSLEADETCDTAGIINTSAAMIASIAVTQVLKMITSDNRKSELISYNVWKNTLTKITPKRNKNCKVCGGMYEYLDGKHVQRAISYCGGEHYQFRVKDFDFRKHLRQLGKQGVKKGLNYLMLNSVSVFKDGRVVVRAKNEKHAKAVFAKYFPV